MRWIENFLIYYRDCVPEEDEDEVDDLPCTHDTAEHQHAHFEVVEDEMDMESDIADTEIKNPPKLSDPHNDPVKSSETNEV